MNDSLHISQVALPDGVTPVIDDRDFYHCHHCRTCRLKSEAADADEAKGEGEEGGEEEATEE